MSAHRYFLSYNLSFRHQNWKLMIQQLAHTDGMSSIRFVVQVDLTKSTRSFIIEYLVSTFYLWSPCVCKYLLCSENLEASECLSTGKGRFRRPRASVVRRFHCDRQLANGEIWLGGRFVWQITLTPPTPTCVTPRREETETGRPGSRRRTLECATEVKWFSELARPDEKREARRKLGSQ